MRIGEIIGLRWEDVNFKSSTIHVKQAIRKGIVSTPKTENSIREIEVLPLVESALKSQYRQTGLKKGYVFLTQFGEHFQDASTINRRHWKPLLQQIGIDYRTLYQTRHTFASVMLQQGEEASWISKMMGHSDVYTTLTRYAKFIPNSSKRRATFMDDLKIEVS